MTLRVCSTPGCPELVNAGKCTAHRREAERARGSSTQRGYGYAHQQQRQTWVPLVATGMVRCRRCREYIACDEAWDLGHDDHDRVRPTAPEHPACNRATGGR